MNNAVKYKDVWLAKNSQAYEMYEQKDFKKLDQHLKMLEVKERELLSKHEKKDKQ